MVDVRDLKWEVLEQTGNDMLCRWKKVQVSYYDTKFHFNVDWFGFDAAPNPKYLAEDLVEFQKAALEEIEYRIKQTRKELKNQTLHQVLTSYPKVSIYTIMTDLRTQNENIINEILLSLGYTNVTITRSKHPDVDFQCNMNEAKSLYDIEITRKELP